MEKLTPEQVVQKLGSLSVMELISLTRELEQLWGIKAAPPVVKPALKTEPDVPVSVQTEFNVTLMPTPLDKKMSVIKGIREFLTLGLKESKDLVESAPKVIREAVSKDEADELKRRLELIGAVVEVK